MRRTNIARDSTYSHDHILVNRAAARWILIRSLNNNLLGNTTDKFPTDSVLYEIHTCTTTTIRVHCIRGDCEIKCSHLINEWENEESAKKIHTHVSYVIHKTSKIAERWNRNTMHYSSVIFIEWEKKSTRTANRVTWSTINWSAIKLAARKKRTKKCWTQNCALKKKFRCFGRKTLFYKTFVAALLLRTGGIRWFWCLRVWWSHCYANKCAHS